MPKSDVDDYDAVRAFVRLPNGGDEARRNLAGANKMVPGPGLEPGYSASKADVLPIRRSRNCPRNFSRHLSPSHARKPLSMKIVLQEGFVSEIRIGNFSQHLEFLLSGGVRASVLSAKLIG